jgi:hypothetical protein
MSQSPDIQRIIYDEGVAPFGQMEFIRLGDHPTDSTGGWASIYTMMVVREAWLTSEWLSDSIGDLAVKALAEENHWFGGMSSVSRNMMGNPNLTDEESWIAVPTASLEAESREESLAVLEQPVLAYGRAKLDSTGNAFSRTVKRLLLPGSMYASVPDVDVLPERQGQGLGVATFDACHANFEDDRTPMTYVLQPNQQLISFLQELGYGVTGERERADLLPGYKLTEARLQADSVAEVRNRLAESFPWLEDARVIID